MSAHLRSHLGLPLGSLLVAAACVSTTPAAPVTPAPEPAAEASPEAEPTPNDPSDPRELPAPGSFADLVRAARTLDERSEDASDAGCQLGRRRERWYLAADLAVAVRPLPDAGDDFASRLDGDRGAVRILSRWGQLGEGERTAVVAFTSAPPPPADSDALVVFVSADGARLRTTAGEVDGGAAGPFPIAEAEARVEALMSRAPTLQSVVVAAEGAVSLARLTELLSRLPARAAASLTLGVPLPAGARLPEALAATTPEASPEHTCPDGLPELPADAEAGELSAEALSSALAPIASSAGECVATAGPQGARGGQLTLLLRVAPDGSVQTACAQQDDLGDPSVLACLLERFRAARFSAPEPAGYVDAALPLRLSPDTRLRQSPLCP